MHKHCIICLVAVIFIRYCCIKENSFFYDFILNP